jgi:hypothetical protein
MYALRILDSFLSAVTLAFTVILADVIPLELTFMMLHHLVLVCII